jgi:hypothetical protein
MGEIISNKTNLLKLIPEVYNKSIDDFCSEALNCWTDRIWCKQHELNYSSASFRDVAVNLYQDYLNYALTSENKFINYEFKKSFPNLKKN